MKTNAHGGYAQLLVVIDLELVLAPGGRVGDVELRREEKKSAPIRDQTNTHESPGGAGASINSRRG